MLQKGDYRWKFNLHGAYFYVPLKTEIKEICTGSVGRDTLWVPLSLFWFRSISSNIYQNFKGANFPLEMALDSCDNIFGRYVTYVTDIRRAINEQRYNFSSDSIRICSQFQKAILGKSNE